MSPLLLQKAVDDGAAELTPQGLLLIDKMATLYGANKSFETIFEQMGKIVINRSKEAQKNPMLVGDGISGEQGAHYVASEDARGFDVIAPDVTRDASMVTGAYRYLSFIQKEHFLEIGGLSPMESPMVTAGKFFVGAANIAEPLSFAQTVGPVINGAAIYLSLAYAPRLEISIVLGGALAAQALGDKVSGVLRLQSPTTMHAKKNDLTPKQGFSYAFAQWLKDLSALVEADGGKQTAVPVWPIVRTFSVEQNKSFRQLIEEVNAHPYYGIRFATAKEGGEKIEAPLKELINAIQENLENTSQVVLTADHSAGLRTHQNVTMTIIAKAMAAIAFKGVKAKLFGKSKSSRRQIADSSTKAQYVLSQQDTRVDTIQGVKKLLKQSSGLLASALGPKGALTLLNKGVDANSEASLMAARQSLFGTGVLEYRLRQSGSFPLLILEEIRKSNPNQTQWYVKRDESNQITEVGLFEPASGGRFGFRLRSDRRMVGNHRLVEAGTIIEMFIKGPTDHPGAEIVMPYEYDPNNRDEDGQRYPALVAQASPVVASQSIGYSKNIAPIQQTEFFDKAWQELGLKVADSVTGLSQNVVGQILKILAAPELGFDLSSLTIDSLTFKGNVQGPRTDYLQSFTIDSKSAGEKTDVSGKKVIGEFVDGRILTKDVDGNIVNEVGARLFIKGNQVDGQAQEMQQPKPMKLGPNGVAMNLTPMGAELWKTFVALGGDPNVIHTIDLAGSATGAKGAFAPGFGLAAQIETKLRQKFGALVDELSLTLFGRMGPGMSYDMRINPVSETEPHFDLQVIKKGNRKKGKSDEVVIAGSFKLQSTQDAEIDAQIDTASQGFPLAFGSFALMGMPTMAVSGAPLMPF